MKRCPNCGACQECGYGGYRPPTPWYGPCAPNPYWYQYPNGGAGGGTPQTVGVKYTWNTGAA